MRPDSLPPSLLTHSRRNPSSPVSIPLPPPASRVWHSRPRLCADLHALRYRARTPHAGMSARAKRGIPPSLLRALWIWDGLLRPQWRARLGSLPGPDPPHRTRSSTYINKWERFFVKRFFPILFPLRRNPLPRLGIRCQLFFRPRRPFDPFSPRQGADRTNHRRSRRSRRSTPPIPIRVILVIRGQFPASRFPLTGGNTTEPPRGHAPASPPGGMLDPNDVPSPRNEK